MMITRESARRILKTYGEAWEEQDVQKILSIFHEDRVYRERAFDTSFNGHEEIAAYWKSKVCEEQSNIEFKPLNTFIDGDTVIAEWEAWFDSNLKEARLHIKEVAIIEVEGDKIRSLREYWQSETLD